MGARQEWGLPIGGQSHRIPEIAMNTSTSSHSSAPLREADGRDGRVVGDNDDSPMESLGKAVVAPVEGADEGAGRVGSSGDGNAEPVDGEHGRAFVDLTRTLPQGEDETARAEGAAPVPKPEGNAL
jgi:hypothetical protein